MIEIQEKNGDDTDPHTTDDIYMHGILKLMDVLAASMVRAVFTLYSLQCKANNQNKLAKTEGALRSNC